MKCPVCILTDTPSQVYPPQWIATFDMGWTPHYDTDGTYHSHDPNHWPGVYRCDEGHEWVPAYRVCRNCDWGATSEQIRRANPCPSCKGRKTQNEEVPSSTPSDPRVHSFRVVPCSACEGTGETAIPAVTP